jgi:hypothetical protein
MQMKRWATLTWVLPGRLVVYMYFVVLFVTQLSKIIYSPRNVHVLRTASGRANHEAIKAYPRAH